MTINTDYGDGFCPSIYVKTRLRSNSIRIIAPRKALVKHFVRKLTLVTHTGFEPMLTA